VVDDIAVALDSVAVADDYVSAVRKGEQEEEGEGEACSVHYAICEIEYICGI